MKIYKLRYETGAINLVEECAKITQSSEELVSKMLRQYEEIFQEIEHEGEIRLTALGEVNADGQKAACDKEDLIQSNSAEITACLPRNSRPDLQEAVGRAVSNVENFSMPVPDGKAAAAKRVVTIGMFDSVHRGHQEIINRLVYTANLHSMIATCYSFDKLPKLKQQGKVMSEQDKRQELARLGVEEYIEQEFNPDFANLSAAEFVEKILVAQLHTQYLFVGENFRFAQGQSAGVEELAALCRQHGIVLETVPLMRYNGEVISTTWIRKLLQAGEIQLANMLMGHNFKVAGHVKNGRGLARYFNFPTANTAWNEEQIKLPHGVYATRATVNNVAYNAISNFGVRPTVSNATDEPTVETSLLDVRMNLYNKDIIIEFLNFQRVEKCYPSFLVLTAAIQEDVQQTRNYHDSLEQFYRYYDSKDTPFYHLPSKRFISGNLSLLLALPLTERNATCMTLLGNILTSCSAAYPTHQEYLKRLDELYGVEIGADTCALGNVEILQLDLQSIFRAPDGTSTFREGTDLLFDSIFHPLMDEEEPQLLNRRVFEQEKKNLLSDLEAKIDDRDSYALKKALEELYAGTDYAADPHGAIACLQALTLEELSAFWQDLLQRAQIMLFTGGNIGQKTLYGLKKHLDDFPSSTVRYHMTANVQPRPFRLQKLLQQTEYCSFVRSRYLLFFSNLPRYSSNDSLVLQLLLSLLVGDVQSLLFKKIREELGLVYGINYDLLNFMDCLVLILALNEDKVELAKVETMKIIQMLQAGELSDELFNNTKLLLRNEILNTTDSLFGLMSYYMNQQLRNLITDKTLLLDSLQAITKEQVIQVAREMTYRGFYHLIESRKNEEKQGNE